MITPEMDMAAAEILFIYAVATVGISCLIALAAKLYKHFRDKKKEGIMVEVRPDPVRQYTLTKALNDRAKAESWSSLVSNQMK